MATLVFTLIITLAFIAREWRNEIRRRIKAESSAQDWFDLYSALHEKINDSDRWCDLRDLPNPSNVRAINQQSRQQS